VRVNLLHSFDGAEAGLVPALSAQSPLPLRERIKVRVTLLHSFDGAQAGLVPAPSVGVIAIEAWQSPLSFTHHLDFVICHCFEFRAPTFELNIEIPSRPSTQRRQCWAPRNDP
jgi:hypothetical protein